MFDVAMTLTIVLIFVVIVAYIAAQYPRDIRWLPWVALGEYLVCATFQFQYAVDAGRYLDAGTRLAALLDIDFGWATKELLLMLFQRDSAFDSLIIGSGSNTGSMHAIAAWFMFVVRGSSYACQALVTGCALLGAFALYGSFRDAFPAASKKRLFIATVLFPSVAFWTSSFHKESFCLMGMGLFFAGWTAIRNGQFRWIPYLGFGLLLIGLVRAPALPPLLLGVIVHYVLTRMQKVRGIGSPIYLALGIAAMTLGLLAVSAISPKLGVEHITETVADSQEAWAHAQGGSSIDVDNAVDRTTSAQILHAPLGLFNSLFRPQLFDVKNPLILVSALEMTFITFLVIRAIRLDGFSAFIRRIRSSPFLAMCAIVTIVGGTFVGLTTRNLGSLARYRVPFLPFYGALLSVLSQRTREVATSATAAAKAVIASPTAIRRRPIGGAQVRRVVR